MHTLLFLISGLDVHGLFIAVASGNKLATQIRDFIAPLFLLAVGIAALSFLFRRQITEFLQFCALAVGISLFFYFPGVLEGLAKVLHNALS